MFFKHGFHNSRIKANASSRLSEYTIVENLSLQNFGIFTKIEA